MLQVSLSQLHDSIAEFQLFDVESYDSELEAQMELDLLEFLLEDVF